MNGIMNLDGLPRFINGELMKNAEGELLLNTRSGSIPVSLEGASIPLGEEVIFKFVRAEPGKLILTPLSKWETIEETLPFLKSISQAERGEWERLVRAAIQEELPLDKNVLLSLRKWSLTAEKSWGVKVEPRVFAFLISKGLPVNQATVLWALYTRYPSVQKEMWRQLFLIRSKEASFSSELHNSSLNIGERQSQTENLGRVNEGHPHVRSKDILNMIMQTTNSLGKVGTETSSSSKSPELNNQRMTETFTGNTQPTDGTGKFSEAVEKFNQNMQSALSFTQERTGGRKGTSGVEKNTHQLLEKVILSDKGTKNEPQIIEGKASLKANSVPVGVNNQESDGNRGLNQTNKLKEDIQREESTRAHAKNIDPRELWTEILRGSSRFMANQSREDHALAQLIFCLFPHHDKEVRWEARGQGGEDNGDGYSFRLSYNSRELKQVEIIGANSRDGLELLIGVENISSLQPHFAEMKSFLTSRGWKVKRVRVMEITEGKSEETDIPRRVDGWV